MEIKLPEKVSTIISILLEHGYEAYAVGGCVRDSLIGREVNDWDITTSANPQEVKVLFRRTIDTGIQHGTVTVILEKEGFEVTTYRIDGEYEDGRHPKEVTFTSNLKEDLRRRDFTINAMAYNEQVGLVDIFGGEKDLEQGIIRCVGVAGERFDEDALRILRAFRFSAQLGFTIEEQTLLSAKERAENLRKISAERIRTELTKLLVSKHPNRLVQASSIGITNVVLPEFDAMLATTQHNKNHQYNVGEHTLHTIEFVADIQRQVEYIKRVLPEFEAETVVLKKEWSKKELQILKYAALLHDVAKPEVRVVQETGEERFPKHAIHSAKLAREILQRFKFDNETIDYVVRLVSAHDEYAYEKTLVGMRKLMYQLGPELIELLLELQMADVLSQHTNSLQIKLEALRMARNLHKEVLERGDCVSLKELHINGRDLIEIGIAPGKQIGYLLNELLLQVLEHPEYNQKEVLLNLAKQMA